jgi:hypothetical protein
MNILGLDIDQIVQLGTQIATTGAVRAFEATGDDLFEMVIGVAFLIYEIDPS